MVIDYWFSNINYVAHGYPIHHTCKTYWKRHFNSRFSTVRFRMSCFVLIKMRRYLNVISKWSLEAFCVKIVRIRRKIFVKIQIYVYVFQSCFQSTREYEIWKYESLMRDFAISEIISFYYNEMFRKLQPGYLSFIDL